jgi:hypothetical protein
MRLQNTKVGAKYTDSICFWLVPEKLQYLTRTFKISQALFRKILCTVSYSFFLTLAALLFASTAMHLFIRCNRGITASTIPKIPKSTSIAPVLLLQRPITPVTEMADKAA